MSEKFDLKEMLREIEKEYEDPVPKKKNVRISQDDIRRLLVKKKKESEGDT